MIPSGGEEREKRMPTTIVQVKTRNTSIELLRIICMMSIIAHHCVVHGGAYTMDNGINKWIALVLLPGGKICFDVFIAISAWYMIDSKFRASRFMKIWLQILFYNLFFTFLTDKLGAGYAAPIGIRDWIGNFFPILGNSHGFAAAYLMFYLFVPFLSMLAHQLSQRQTQLLILLLAASQVFSSLMGSVTRYYQPMPGEVVLFVLFYYIALYLKRWPMKIQSNKPILFAIVLCGWILITAFRIGYALYPDTFFFTWGVEITANESSLSNIISGFALFLLVKDWKMPHIPMINTVASTTFGILLYHDHNFFRPVIWQRFIKASTWYYVPPMQFVFYIVLSVLGVFIVGMLVDFGRQFLEKQIFRSIWMKKVCEMIERFYAGEKCS